MNQSKPITNTTDAYPNADVEMMAYTFFHKWPLDCNLWFQANKGYADLSFWLNEFILVHHLVHHSMIRIIDKNFILNKTIDRVGSKYIKNIEYSESLPLQQILAFDQDGGGELNRVMKSWILNMVLRGLKYNPDKQTIIVFTDLPDFVKNREPGLTEEILKIYRYAPFYDSGVLTVFRSVEEIEQLGDFGKEVISLSTAVFASFLQYEDMINLRRLGFFVMPVPRVICREPATE